MIEAVATGCRRFQCIASAWLRSGEITRTKHLLSPLEELAGFNYGFVYLLEIRDNPLAKSFATVKLGYSEHPARRIRELRHTYGEHLRLRACFVGDAKQERAMHARFAHLRVENERFLASGAIDTVYAQERERIRTRLRTLHLCTPDCPQLVKRLDLRMLRAWLGR
ncbi:MAG: GIY-YIG nuclease family protein [Candidatus Eremiobacteraeota bacterium]|nr:GIY-YIG nuclease family protein [Candidatus Eremiobacteraeota bacterium]